MTTTAKKIDNSVASRWKAGTQHYLESFEPVAREIHERAANMPHDSLEDSAAIVEMAVERIKRHASDYHKSNAEG